MNPTTGMSDGGASFFYQGVKLWVVSIVFRKLVCNGSVNSFSQIGLQSLEINEVSWQ